MKTQISPWSIFLVCTTAILAAVPWLVVPSYSQTNAVEQQRPDEDIIFPPKLFLNVEAYVWIVGTLTGDWVAFKNNTYTFLCGPEECWVANVEQVGPRQVSQIDGPTRYPVIRWTPDEVVASDNTLCSKITITIGRKTQELLWVEMPINQTAIECENANNSIRKATIETSLYLQRSKPNN